MGGGSYANRPSFTRSNSDRNGTLNTFMPNWKNEEKKKVFISYSMRNKAQAELLKYQVKSDNYDIDFADTSLKYAIKGKSWKPIVKYRIENSDALIVMIGKDTYSRPAVSYELNVAYDNDIPVIPIFVHRDTKVKLPPEILYNNEQPINWNLDDIDYEVNYAS